MRTNAIHGLILLVTVTLAACSDRDGTSPRPGVTVASSNARVQTEVDARTHRFTAECQTTFNSPPLPLPPVQHQVDDGSCHFVPFGPMQFRSIQDIDFAAHTQSGTQTYTARNGDQIFAVHSGTSAPAGPGLIAFSATMTVVGGTGRFASASGFATVAGRANLMTNTSTSSSSGWITLRNPE
jgi:hypothetical protein